MLGDDPLGELLLAGLAFTVGDEFQGSYPSVGGAIDAALTIRLAVAPDIDVRFGIGWGAVTVLDATTGIQDGPGWWTAREAITWTAAAQRQPGLALVRTSFRADEPSGPDDDLGNRRREAAMRRVLRAVLKAEHERVAFVCGAYHAPVLHPDVHPSVASDNALLKGLPKVKVAATWAPWTAGRLARASGYGAGVTSPGWYEHLFTTTDDVVARWMVRVAGALRAEGLDASSASVVEAGPPVSMLTPQG